MSRSARWASILIAAAALLGGLAPAAPERDDPNVELARDQLRIIDLAFKDMDAMMSGGQLNAGDPRFGAWGKRKLDALRAARLGKEEMVAALNEYLARMKVNESRVRKLHETGQASLLDARDAQYRRLEAEMWLNTEKAR